MQGLVFGLVGFSAGIVGTTLSNGLLALRKKLDPEFKLQNPAPGVLPNSACWGTHMAVSSNLRYQMLNGLDMVSHPRPCGHKASDHRPCCCMACICCMRDWERPSGAEERCGLSAGCSADDASSAVQGAVDPDQAGQQRRGRDVLRASPPTQSPGLGPALTRSRLLLSAYVSAAGDTCQDARRPAVRSRCTRA